MTEITPAPAQEVTQKSLQAPDQKLLQKPSSKLETESVMASAAESTNQATAARKSNAALNAAPNAATTAPTNRVNRRVNRLSKKERTKEWIKPPKLMNKLVGKAIAQYKMLRDGDRVLLGLSGGKDSMALLAILKHIQRHAPIHFEIAACTIDPEIPGFDPSPLKAWCAALEVPYFYESENMVKLAEEQMIGNSFCSFCARQKRGILYTTCRREGYNVLALAQHLDDAAESFVMSAFNAGQLRTMKAHYLNDDEDVRIIRPLIRVREWQTREFAADAALPVIEDNCPACYAKPQAREQTKQLLLAQEKINPHLFANLWRAMQPLIADDNHQGQANIASPDATAPKEGSL